MAAYPGVARKAIRHLSDARGGRLGATRPPTYAAALGRVRAGCREKCRGAGERMGAPPSKYPSSPITFVSNRNHQPPPSVLQPLALRVSSADSPGSAGTAKHAKRGKWKSRCVLRAPCLWPDSRSYVLGPCRMAPALPIHPEDVCSGKGEQRTLPHRKTR